MNFLVFYLIYCCGEMYLSNRLEHIRVGRGDHSALGHQALGLLQCLSGLDGGLHSGDLAVEQDKGFSAQTSAQTHLQQIDLSRFGGGIGGVDGGAEGVSLHDAEGVQTEGREKAGRRTEVRQVQYTLYRTRAQMTFTVSLALTGHMNIRPTQMATGSADQKNQ